MDVSECIRTRRSIRKYSGAAVELEKIAEIVKAGKAAPCAGNVQNWRFIIVTDQGRREKIAEACLQQYWMSHAPVHVVVCALIHAARKYYGVRGERLYSVQNCASAATLMLMRAQELGLGACWVGAFEEEMLKKALSMAPFARPQVVITLGYPDEVVPEPIKSTLEEVTFFQRWGTRIKDMDLTVGRIGEYNKRQVHRAKAYLKDKSDVFNARVQTTLDKLKESFSKK